MSVQAVFVASMAGAFSWANVSHAQFLIDDFSTDQTTIFDSGNSVTGGGIYGEWRDILPSFIGDGSDPLLTSQRADVSGGSALVRDSVSGRGGFTLFAYDGPGVFAYGLPATELSAAGGRFEFDVLAVSGDLGASTWDIQSDAVQVSSAGLWSLPVEDINLLPHGDPDLAEVRGITLGIGIRDGGSIEIDNFRYIPSPGAATALAVGALAVVRRRRAH